MKVVIITHIDKLGQIGETIDVAEGFARNYLVPRGIVCLPGDSRATEARKCALQEKQEKPHKEKEIKPSKREKRIIRQVKEKKAIQHDTLKEGNNGTRF
ncbi:hypothetical protein GW889_00055 [Candidatus Berkelbacteria bacterium]|uniref:Ribosomal protein L9 domain-containing protein n=1 Tax=Candidatus Berkelbacteria bacterium CG10_big_fil_rev_8_21_14_0_10_43_14 TaxID=1974515 RepID=A0A2M6R9Q0_9BACT|nr:hypothetical protein [Candidatus Berkelbacteria bacterium]OIP06228.1 MAG: hypothetical protein AUK41_03160 [Candidatus Berkelbacteria bacterium CG2_30_43_20]PIS07275.1 MAG: hypothetical protein COT79_00190 [Candidatus Berkelbacteria bacterium CG10_big_fil_rev_8_21_14_0_10_43_14]PIU87521.1 MAG: hypothetical protein COS66_00410 [Candidatus Berkelbacteria bacterium CG06_land_8_20_14_3_00_43_10]